MNEPALGDSSGELHGAERLYAQAIALPRLPDDELAKLHGNRAACLLAMGDAAAALQPAARAAELTPYSAKQVYRLGCVHAELGDTRTAVEVLRRHS